MHADSGCSRTNPVTWLGVAGQNVQVQVKREPQHVQVSELVAVKLEQASPGNKPDHPPPAIPASLNNGKLTLLQRYGCLVRSYRIMRDSDENGATSIATFSIFYFFLL